jgi:hypothetical protein
VDEGPKIKGPVNEAIVMPSGRYEACLVLVEDLAVEEVPVCVDCGWLADAHDDHGHATVVTLATRTPAAVRRAS